MPSLPLPTRSKTGGLRRRRALCHPRTPHEPPKHRTASPPACPPDCLSTWLAARQELTSVGKRPDLVRGRVRLGVRLGVRVRVRMRVGVRVGVSVRVRVRVMVRVRRGYLPA